MAMAGAANEMINGGTKCLKDKYGPKCRLDARVFVNPANTRTIYELHINTLGVGPWEGDAQMASLSTALEPAAPTNNYNITSFSGLSNFFSVGLAMDCAGIPQKTGVLVNLVCEEMNGGTTPKQRPSATQREHSVAAINAMNGGDTPMQRPSATGGRNAADANHITPHLANLQPSYKYRSGTVAGAATSWPGAHELSSWLALPPDNITSFSGLSNYNPASAQKRSPLT